MSCFIIKKPFSNTIYSISRNDRQTVVAFTDKRQVNTYTRLVQEIDGYSAIKWSNKRLFVEKIDRSELVKMCTISQLDCIIYENDHQYMIYESCWDVIDNIRFYMEVKYKYH